MGEREQFDTHGSEFARWKIRCVGLEVGVRRSEVGGVVGKRALAGTQPTALHVDLLSVGSHFADRRFEVGVWRVDLIHRLTEPGPTMTVSSVSGAVTKPTPVPSGIGSQS